MASIDQREGISGVGMDGMPQSSLTGTVPIPSSSIKIFIGDSGTAGALSGGVAENVKIGDKLTLVISIDQQGTFNVVWHFYISLPIFLRAYKELNQSYISLESLHILCFFL